MRKTCTPSSCVAAAITHQQPGARTALHADALQLSVQSVTSVLSAHNPVLNVNMVTHRGQGAKLRLSTYSPVQRLVYSIAARLRLVSFWEGEQSEAL